ncbi:MAG: hypothetical protein PHF00_05895, partial [Elusimicrobia bacterium]|nr:hypothetical protein [Elusimicrobiota bacterium]
FEKLYSKTTRQVHERAARYTAALDAGAPDAQRLGKEFQQLYRPYQRLSMPAKELFADCVGAALGRTSRILSFRDLAVMYWDPFLYRSREAVFDEYLSLNPSRAYLWEFHLRAAINDDEALRPLIARLLNILCVDIVLRWQKYVSDPDVAARPTAYTDNVRLIEEFKRSLPAPRRGSTRPKTSP